MHVIVRPHCFYFTFADWVKDRKQIWIGFIFWGIEYFGSVWNVFQNQPYWLFVRGPDIYRTVVHCLQISKQCILLADCYGNAMHNDLSHNVFLMCFLCVHLQKSSSYKEILKTKWIWFNPTTPLPILQKMESIPLKITQTHNYTYLKFKANKWTTPVCFSSSHSSFKTAHNSFFFQ